MIERAIMTGIAIGIVAIGADLIRAGIEVLIITWM